MTVTMPIVWRGSTHGLLMSRPLTVKEQDSVAPKPYGRSPALPGGSSSLTFSAVHRDFRLREPPRTRKSVTMDEFESLSHRKWD